MAGKTKIELKKLYYLDHFNEMLKFVVDHNGELLEDCHLQFIDRFRQLRLEDQCLFVRLANRKGSIFLVDQIGYEEVTDCLQSIARLKVGRFFRSLNAGDFDDFVSCLPRKELLNLIRSLEVETTRPGSAKKAELCQAICLKSNFESVVNSPGVPQAVVVDCEELEYLLFLYFGRIEESLSVFALRDLGIMKTRGRTRFKPRFESCEVAKAAFEYRKIRHNIGRAKPEKLISLVGGVKGWPVVDDLEVQSLRNQVLYQLGRAVERQISSQKALSVYLQSDQFPSTERAVRILYQLGDRAEAQQRLRQLIDNPSCDEELIFSEDYYQRKFGERRVGRLTEVLNGARIFKLDEAGRDYPEGAVVSFLERSGANAWHGENLIWTQLFGVVFWEVLFGDEAEAIHSDFDRLPAGLNSRSFFQENKPYIDNQLNALEAPGWISSRIAEVKGELELKPNWMVYSDPGLFDLLDRLVSHSPPGAVSIVLREMAGNFKANRSGFPDLMVLEDGVVRFIEVKSEGDRIQRHQLAQIERLRRAGYTVEVARIQWCVDPDQEYIVVDVETTGGNPAWNRVTEIGAVKFRGGQVIDQWSSLINPGRRIPGKIVKLTGITDDMVASAPAFSDIADELRRFLGDRVFVGHRVKFDYGYIREEYRRIGQTYRAPTFCTAAETRRYFPGLKSYSLANLCQEFDIPLESHHRALCDAKATAQLLSKINARRQENRL